VRRAGCLKTNENYRKIRPRTTAAAVERIISISRPPSSRVYSPKTEKPPAGGGAGRGGPARIINKNDRGPEKFFDRVGGDAALLLQLHPGSRHSS